MSATIVQLLPPTEEAEGQRVAIALGLRFTVPDCHGAMQAFACLDGLGRGIFLVHESDIEMRDGASWVTCEPCDSPHEVLSLVEAISGHWIGASASTGDLLVAIGHEELLLAELELRRRALESYRGRDVQA